jgi:hypothetical protein
MPTHPISFSIPECKIVKAVPIKDKEIASIIPGNYSTYFPTEESYYRELQRSKFAYIAQKGGYDTMRIYEILANGCIPKWIKPTKVPPKIITKFPKELVAAEDAKGLLEYTRNNLTTKAMAQYILDTIQSDAKSLLFMSYKLELDYLRCSVLHGFKELLGSRCHDYPKVDHLYTDYPLAVESMYGKGMTLTKLLDPSLHNASNSADPKDYDLVLIHATKEHDVFGITKDAVLLCSADHHDYKQRHKMLCPLRTFPNHVFIRELHEE